MPWSPSPRRTDRLFAVSTQMLRRVPVTWLAPAWPRVRPGRPLCRRSGGARRPPRRVHRPAWFCPWRRGRRGLLVRRARAIGRTLLTAAADRDVGPHALAHLGAVDIALYGARAALEEAAAEIDADPRDLKDGARGRTLRVRAQVEAAATDVINRVGRALGAAPLCHDEAHSRRVADLTVYLRQHHAERNLAELGALVAERGTAW